MDKEFTFFKIELFFGVNFRMEKEKGGVGFIQNKEIFSFKVNGDKTRSMGLV